MANLQPINDQLLVEEIKKYPNLYNPANEYYQDSEVRWGCLRKIAHDFNSVDTVIASRWRYLRDRYVKEKRMNPTGKKGWYLTPAMEFIQPYIRRARNRHSITLPMSLQQPKSWSQSDAPIIVKKEVPEMENNATKSSVQSETSISTSTPNVEDCKLFDVVKEISAASLLPPRSVSGSANPDLTSTDSSDQNEPDSGHCSIENGRALVVSSKLPPRKRPHSYIGTMMKKKRYEETEDEDKTFLIGLLPSLKQLNPECRSQAKIEMLTILHKLRFGKQEDE